MKDYYAILDIEPNATADDIKAQYRFLIQAFHPDKYSGSSQQQKAKAEAKAKEINEAYGVLSNPVKRADYDRSIGRTTYTLPPPQQRPNSNSLILTLAPGVTISMVRIPAGVFLMGSTDDDAKYPDEKPQHKVTLDEYLIGKYDVTNAQFAVFVKATGYKTTAEREGSGLAYDGRNWVNMKGADWQRPKGINSNLSGKDNHPVVLASWDDAVAFCAWVSQVSGRKVALPTEAQWEKAARGTDGRLYPWGNDTPNANLANFNRSVKDTTAVGKYSPAGDSPYGVADLAGNVWEWVSDWYDGNYYTNSPVSNPQGITTGQYRVRRGSGWDKSSTSVRTTHRDSYNPYFRNDFLGFRVAVSAAVP